MTQKDLVKMIVPLEKNFRDGTRRFAAAMIASDTDPQLRRWILSDMSAAPPGVAIRAMNEMAIQYVTGEVTKIFEQIRIPVAAVNGDLWPVNYEANRRHMLSFNAVVLKRKKRIIS